MDVGAGNRRSVVGRRGQGGELRNWCTSPGAFGVEARPERGPLRNPNSGISRRDEPQERHWRRGPCGVKERGLRRLTPWRPSGDRLRAACLQRFPEPCCWLPPGGWWQSGELSPGMRAGKALVRIGGREPIWRTPWALHSQQTHRQFGPVCRPQLNQGLWSWEGDTRWIRLAPCPEENGMMLDKPCVRDPGQW
ncbi:hypothetical protein NDU88_007089 [Pleurodeles waltl]|uniref:Uncharacterized protein n=1 Tax=Pleurodeles waltl TaxID=8319 RepID=A0AAV7N4Z1_PLEWA|nr:hypothetical protein NDU88_007089 [Pleurodeles waltl]